MAGTIGTAAGTTRARSARALRTTSAGTMRTAAGTTCALRARCARLARRGRTPRRRRPRGSAPRRSHSRQRAVRQRGRHPPSGHPPSGHALRPRWRPLRRVRGRRLLHRCTAPTHMGKAHSVYTAVLDLPSTVPVLMITTRTPSPGPGPLILQLHVLAAAVHLKWQFSKINLIENLF